MRAGDAYCKDCFMDEDEGVVDSKGKEARKEPARKNGEIKERDGTCNCNEGGGGIGGIGGVVMGMLG